MYQQRRALKFHIESIEAISVDLDLKKMVFHEKRQSMEIDVFFAQNTVGHYLTTPPPIIMRLKISTYILSSKKAIIQSINKQKIYEFTHFPRNAKTFSYMNK